MKTMTAAQAKNKFGQLLDAAQREPVVITKNDRPVGVLLSIQDIEDTIWGELAKEAAKDGFLSADESEALLRELIEKGK